MTDNLLDVLPIGVWVLDADLRVEAVNAKIQEFFGISCEGFVGQDKQKLVEERIHTIFENGEEFRRRILATYDQNTYSENFLCHVLPTKNRRERWLEHFSQPIRRDGAIVGRVEIYFDVTDRIEYENEINWISTQFIKVQEQEKARIAANLHNHVGQSVIALKFSLERLKDSACSQANEDHQRQIEDVLTQVKDIARDISQISTDLLPPALNSFGIQETLNWLTNYYQSMYGLTIDCQVFGIHDKRFAPEIEIALFRIFQEGLNNVIKHAHTVNAQCKLIYSHPRLIAIVSDQGTGFDLSQSRSGAGLRIMQRRVAELGGKLSIISGEQMGTTLRVVISVAPLTGQSEQMINEGQPVPT